MTRRHGARGEGLPRPKGGRVCGFVRSLPFGSRLTGSGAVWACAKAPEFDPRCCKGMHCGAGMHLRGNRLDGREGGGFLGFAVHLEEDVEGGEADVVVSAGEDQQEGDGAIAEAVPDADDDAEGHVAAEAHFEDGEPELLER